MEASDREINFRTIAAEAAVSTGWLYGQDDCQSALLPSSSQLRERLSRQNIVATLRLRIKVLEEKNRELTGLLELIYGEFALAREKNASAGTSL